MVAALGGNAILQPGQNGTFAEQMENVRMTAAQLAELIIRGNRMVITHGNGPQVGRIFLQQEKGLQAGIPEMPLFVCGAMSQGQMGYMIQQALYNELLKAGCQKTVVTLICQSLVDAGSPAFDNPTKPIGSFYSEGAAQKMALEKGEIWKEDSGRGWRRVVPSPEPQGCMEIDAIKSLIAAEAVVIVSGGGGIPVVKGAGGNLSGIDAVVDKDLGAQVIARETGAEVLLLLTDVENVATNFRTSREQKLKEVNLTEIKEYYQQGHFKAGSMGPKVLAAIRFIEAGGERAVITSLENALTGMEGKTGTMITA
ncbi:MAG: carbamate kinase [Firmicutes bacterium]|nr:carbamate kinase [Bacillota bacterium]